MLSPGRLALARKRRGLTQAELARRTGVLARRLSEYECGRAQPDDVTVHKLAAELRFPRSFFAAEELDEVLPDAVSFRARKKTAVAKRNAAISAAALAVEFNGWLEQRFELPKVAVPTLRGVDPETAAEMVRAEWSMELTSVPSVVHLLESRGVRVFALAPDHVDVDAFSLWHGPRPFLFLNTLTSGERGRFDAAHELGHLVLHSGELEPQSRKAEDEADAFASAFLMPRASVFASMPRAALVSQILEGKEVWKVSAMALTRRLHELGLLKDEHYRTTCVELTRRGYRSAEPNGIPREGSQLLGKVLRSLRDQRIGMVGIADQLSLPLEDLTGLVFGLTITAVSGRGVGQPSTNRANVPPSQLTPVPSS